MKKLIMLLLCGSLLYGCSSSSYSVQVSDAQDSLMSGSQLDITKQDYFEYLLDNYGANEVLNEALLSIADKELTDQDAIDKAVKEKEEEYAKYANGSLEDYAKNSGYSSKDDFINNEIIPTVKRELLVKKYIDENLDKLIEEYQVTSFKKIVVDKESTALSIIKEIKSEEDFDKKMEEYGSDAEDAGMVTKNSTLDDNLKKALKDLSQVKKDGIYKEAIKLADEQYAIIYLYDTDHKNTDDIKTTIASDTEAQTDIEGHYLSKYEFEVHDSKIKEGIKNISSDYIE